MKYAYVRADYELKPFATFTHPAKVVLHEPITLAPAFSGFRGFSYIPASVIAPENIPEELWSPNVNWQEGRVVWLRFATE